MGTGLRERQKEGRRRAIERSALDLFVSKGIERTTVDEIAAAAEVSKGTFFNYFSSKDEVLGRRVAHLAEDFLSLAESSEGDDPVGRLKRLFAGAEQRFRAEGPDLLRLYGAVMTQPKLQALDRDVEARIFAYYEAEFDEGRRAGLFARTLDPTLAAQMIIDLWSATLRLWMLAGGDFGLADVLGAKLDLLVSGLAVRPSR